MAKLIALDPGHGGADPGAVYKGVRECDIARAIARKLQLRLLDEGRLDAKTIFELANRNPNMTWIASSRRGFLSKLAASGDIQFVLSVHANAADVHTDENSPSGLVVCYKDSQEHAQAMYDEMVAIGDANNYELRGNRSEILQYREGLAMLNTPMSELLVEIGFITNALDLKTMTSEQGQIMFAEGVANGLYRILEA